MSSVFIIWELYSPHPLFSGNNILHFSTSCQKWVHKKCGGIKGSMYKVMKSFICVISDIAIFVLKSDVKLQPTIIYL